MAQIWRYQNINDYLYNSTVYLFSYFILCYASEMYSSSTCIIDVRLSVIVVLCICVSYTMLYTPVEFRCLGDGKGSQYYSAFICNESISM